MQKEFYNLLLFKPTDYTAMKHDLVKKKLVKLNFTNSFR